MNAHRLILPFIFLINIIRCLPSKEIWEKIVDFIDSGKMRTPNNKNFFLFDEKNYTQLDINSKKMKYLYDLQYRLYKKYNLSNYILVVDSLNEKIESIEDCAINIGDYLIEKYKVNLDSAILALFSIKTRRVTIRTGKDAEYKLSNYELSKIIKHLGKKMRAKLYYKAWIELLNEIDFYYKDVNLLLLFVICIFYFIILFVINFISYFVILFFIIFIIALICYIIDLCKNLKKKSLPNDSKLKKIVNFLKKQESNKKILSDNCAICLEKFDDSNTIENENVKKKIDKDIILNVEKEDASEKLLKNEKDNISVLKCGHMFHSNCIKKWMERKKECPLCRQKINNYCENDTKIIWRLQNEIHFNKYINIDYNDLFYLDFYSFSDYSFGHYLEASARMVFSSKRGSNGGGGGGGFHSGGGATGGW